MYFSTLLRFVVSYQIFFSKDFGSATLIQSLCWKRTLFQCQPCYFLDTYYYYGNIYLVFKKDIWKLWNKFVYWVMVLWVKIVARHLLLFLHTYLNHPRIFLIYFVLLQIFNHSLKILDQQLLVNHCGKSEHYFKAILVFSLATDFYYGYIK